MSDLEEYGLEMEPDNHGADPELMPSKPVVVKKSGIGGKILALALGFVIGAGGVIGGVAGAGYWAVTQPVQDVLDTVNTMTGAGVDFSQYINPEYAKLTIMNLVGEIATVAGKFASGQGCFNDLAAISPYVGTALDPLLETLDGFGLSLNKEDLMAKPVAELPNYVLETAKDMKLVDILSSVGANVEDPLYKALCYTEDNQPVTIRTLLEDPSSLLNNVPLATLLIGDKVIDPEKDGLLLSIAYGNANRYVVDTAQNLVVMNAMRFTKEGDKFYDIDGNEVTATLEDGVYTVTVKGEKVYLNASEPNVYFAYEDVAFASPVYYKKVMLGDLMNGGIMEVFYTIELGSLLNISPLDTDPDPITLALAYGEEGTHYEIVDDKIVWLDNGEGGKYKPRTVGTLLEGNLTDLISDIKLGTLFNVSPLDADPDPLTLALAYGYEGTHYKIVDGKVVWQDNGTGGKYKPKTVQSLTKGDAFGDLRLATALNVDIFQTPGVDCDAMAHALSFGYQGTHYLIKTDEHGNKVVKWLPKTIDPETGEVSEYYSYRTINDMSEMGTMLDDLRLATVLGVKIDDPSADAMTHAIAFGYEGTDFMFVGDDVYNMDGVTPYDGYRTVSDMSNMNDIINGLRIETALSIKPNPNGTRLLQVLAYGSDLEYSDNGDGTYSIVNPDYNTIADLSSSENNLIDRLTINDMLGEENIKDDILLSHLGDATLATLPDEIGKLTFKRVYPRQIFQNDYVVYEGSVRKILHYIAGTGENPGHYEYEDHTPYLGSESDVILEYYYSSYTPEGGSVVNTPGSVAESKLFYNDATGFYNFENDEGKTCEAHLVLNGQWKYLLVDPDDPEGYAHDYPLTNFAVLVSNMTKNMTKARLYDLNDDKIILLDTSTLGTVIVTNMSILGNDFSWTPPEGATASNPDGKLRLGDLTVTQIMSYTAEVISFLSHFSA